MINNFSKTYTATTIIAIALASMLMLTPSSAWAAAHIQGRDPVITVSGNTISSTSFDIAGLGNTPATATLSITGVWATECTNPGGNVAPGQSDEVSASSPAAPVSTTKNGRATVPALSATAPEPTDFGCPNGKWTGEATEFTLTSATVTVTQNGNVVFQFP